MENIDEEVEAERLRHVRALIEELLQEADVCGQVILAGRGGRFEHFTDVRASWCKLRLVEAPDGSTGVGIRSKREDYGGDVAQQKRELEWSVGTASGFATIGAQVSLSWLEAARQIDRATNATHSNTMRKDPRDKR